MNQEVDSNAEFRRSSGLKARDVVDTMHGLLVCLDFFVSLKLLSNFLRIQRCLFSGFFFMHILFKVLHIHMLGGQLLQQMAAAPLAIVHRQHRL